MVRLIYINVSPAMGLFGYVDTAWQLPADQSRRTMSSLMAENSKAARMANLRSAVVESFAQVFGCSDYDMHTGHPQLSPQNVLDRKSTRLNSSHALISYAVFCLKKKKK